MRLCTILHNIRPGPGHTGRHIEPQFSVNLGVGLADKKSACPDALPAGRKGQRKGEPSMSMQYVKQQIRSLECGLQNRLMNLLPDCWISSRLLRPRLGRLLGMQCGGRTFLRKGNYYGKPRNIRIGAGTRLNREVFLDAFDKITLGSNVFVGFQVSFITSTHELGGPEKRCGPLYGQPIVVEDGVWIGACAKIGPGVTVGAGSVVAIGAVVTRSVPPNSVVAGVPARVVMRLDSQGTAAASDAPPPTTRTI